MLNNRLLHFFLIIILFISVSCKTHYSLKYSNKSVIAVDTLNVKAEDPVSLQILTPYKNKIDSELNEIIAYADEAMEKGLPEGKLNNFVTDLTLLIANKHYKPKDEQSVDICILNSGGLRSSLPKGAINTSKVFELMPFENKLVVLTLSGKQTLSMLNWIASIGGVPMAGAKIGIQNDKAVEILINGAAFNEEKNYKIVTSDYLAAGGDKYSFFKEPLNSEDLDILSRDAIIEYMKDETAAGRTLNPQLDKRIYYVR